MDYSSFVPVIGTIINVTIGIDCCSRMLTLRTSDGIANFVVTQDTIIVDNRELRPGMQVVAYYDSSLPMILIFPPQYTAQLITTPGRNVQVMLGYFDQNLMASDGSLVLNLGNNTVVKTVNGQSFTCYPGDRTLLVYYTTTTRSLPPQTTPQKILVLC